ncbi:MAG TPA: DUF1254 domain-containing protein [Gemmatimonadales bacterium]|nr:DUF1254 domain-containing protein [Gemmatimonadales bacterium]
MRLHVPTRSMAVPSLLCLFALATAGCGRRDEPASNAALSADTVGGRATERVTPETFIRAESDRYFFATAQLAGGVNRFNFGRRMLGLDEQTVVRMNRDTFYGAAVIDTKGGATITFPPIPDGRYASILVIDNDHYAPMVIYEPGTYELPARTRYVLAAVRIHVRNPADSAEVALVNALQDRFTIQAASAEPFPAPRWEKASLDSLRAAYEAEFVRYDRYPDGWMGPPGQVDEATRHLAAAGGWGLFPNRDALYINYRGDHPADGCYRATYTVPENGAFWSITMYGRDGFMESERAVLNGSNTRFNADGTFTAHFGSERACGAVPNRLDIGEGWNFLMRIYRPGPSVLSGKYQLPPVERVGA